MHTLQPGIAAALLIAFRESSHSVSSTKKLLDYFSPFIIATARRYRREWQDDLIQEGRIVLTSIATSFAKHPQDFLPYVMGSIRNAMFAFNNSIVRLATSSFSTCESELDRSGADAYKDIPDGIDRLLKLDMSIDFKHYLKPDKLSTLSLTVNEVKAFELFFLHRFHVCEVAKSMNTSLSTASRLVASSKNKVRRILAAYSINNKN